MRSRPVPKRTGRSARNLSNMIHWLEPGAEFPDVSTACGLSTAAPGLLAASQHLDVETLLQAYAAGIFPWFSADQPVLWWSPDPRMVLRTADFRMHRSFRKSLRYFRARAGCEVRVDTAFASVIQACADSPRRGQDGTWIVPPMQRAYIELHRAGYAHSVETWVHGQLVGGLYCTAMGCAVFGESMFSANSGASRIALAALVALCRQHDIELIDCQQDTPHLALLGARTMARPDFCRHVVAARERTGPLWEFRPVYWDYLDS